MTHFLPEADGRVLLSICEEFFVPDSADSAPDADRKLLEKARKLAIKTEFIELRGEFYKWWSDVSNSGMSSAELKADSRPIRGRMLVE